MVVKHVLVIIPDCSHSVQLYIFEDNAAVISVIHKGRSPNVRHIARTHGLYLDWLIERVQLDHFISINYVRVGDPLADMLSKGAFST